MNEFTQQDAARADLLIRFLHVLLSDPEHHKGNTNEAIPTVQEELKTILTTKNIKTFS